MEGSNGLGRPFEKYAWLENIHWDKLVENPDRSRDNVSADVFPVTSVRGYKLYREAMKKVHPLGWGAAMYNLTPSPGYIWRAILEEKPYPVKAVFTQGSDPLLVFAQARKFCEAYLSDKLDLHVAVEQFMTPTAQLADYVLPSADWMERPHVKTMWNLIDHYSLGEQCVQPLFERRDDYQLWRDLGNRLGQQGYWPDTLEQMYDKFLEPSGMKYAEFMGKEEHWHLPAPVYRKWEQQGFATFSGKAELAPSIFEKLGVDPLPRYEEPPRSPLSTPKLAEEYPLILISGSRVKSFTHSCYRQIDGLRKAHPDPVVEVHPRTASRLGFKEGDWVYIETPEGKVKQKARLTAGIDPRVVNADGYWWYPERPGKAPRLFDIWESNINAIVPDEPGFCDYAGDNYFRALLCKVYKAE
ncbi:MAG: molybdopterin dinucleotide binding domain-containing protein [Dehalococcoidia bacterium]|nr:molybdopterin dinucleotide binding domain-containing protein [Dehalococcoidia bacterium]